MAWVCPPQTSIMRYWRSPARRQISSAVFEISSGSRNSSTKRMTIYPPPEPTARLSVYLSSAYIGVVDAGVIFVDRFVVFQAVATNFLHRAVDFSQHAKRAHLVGGVLFADFAHGEADMNQHPVAGHGPVVLQQAEIDSPAHAYHVHESGILVVRRDLDHFPWYSQTHDASLP